MITATTHKINTEELFNKLIEYANKVKSEYFVIDTETNSKSEKLALLYGIGICFNDQRAFFLPWRTQQGTKVWTPEQEIKIANWLIETSKAKKLINHNIIYDVLVLENNLNIDLTPYIYSDTILLKHSIDEDRPFGLKELAVRDLGPWADNAQNKLKESVIANGGKWIKEQKDMYLADTDVLAEYCMWDVLLTYKLFLLYDNKLREQKLEKFFYEDEVMDLYRECTIPMKRAGFPVDVEYFKQLDLEITVEIDKLEEQIQSYIAPEIEEFEMSLLDKEVPIKSTGNFPKVVAKEFGIPLPLKKKVDKITKEISYSITLGAKDVEKQKQATPEYSYFYNWLQNEEKLEIDEIALYLIRKKIFFASEKNSEQRFIFNLASNDHLGHYFFKIKGYTPKDKTAKGKDKLDANFIESLATSENDPIAKQLIEYKKLQKLQSTYIKGILDRHIDGIIYTSMLQFGTTSGRYSSTDPNLQNLPRIKDDESGLSELVLKYVNAIKKGFIAGTGNKIVNADYSQLEPCCFASMSGDKRLQDVFHKGEDLYSRVAIDVFKMTHLSANKKDPNYLKNVSPEFRNKAKVFALAIVYGAEEARISQAMGVDFEEARRTIAAYLNAYPDLKKYMNECNNSAKKYGCVKTIFGRMRHIPAAKALYQMHGNDLLDYRWARANNKMLERKEFKGALNNAKNFPIQGLASSIVNRAMIQIALEFKKAGIINGIRCQVHDEITCVVPEAMAEIAKNIVRQCMEHTTKISVPLKAEPIIGDNWSEAK